MLYALAMTAGIAAASSLGGMPAAWLGLGAAALVTAWLLRRRAGWPLAAMLVACVAVAGGRYLQAARVPPALAVTLGHHAALTGTIAEPPRPAAEGRRAIFALTLTAIGRLPAPGITALAVTPWRADLRHGDRVRLTGLVTAPRPETNPAQVMRRSDYPAVVFVDDPRLLERLGWQPPGLLPRALAALRGRALAVFERGMPGAFPQQMGGLLGSMVLGVTACPLARSISDSFRQAGIIHIAVVSGTQITLLFMAIYCLGGLRRRSGTMTALPRPGLVVAAGLLVLAYVVLVGGGEPTVRAGLMAAVAAVGYALQQVPAVAERHGLQADAYTALAAAGAALLLVSPTSLFVPGAQLSFAAVWGLVYLQPRLAAWHGSPAWQFATASSLAPQVAVLPLLAWHFGALPLAGFAVNLVAVPLAALLLGGGIGALVLGMVWLPAAIPLNWGNRLLMEVILAAAIAAGKLPWLSPQLMVRSAWPVLLYYLVLCAVTEAAWQAHLHRERKRNIVTAGAGA